MEQCRLCAAECEPAFDKLVLNKYNVRYEVCSGCGSLQTEPPYWLDEVYSYSVGEEDLGYLQRNLSNISLARLILSVEPAAGAGVILDYGGGLGLLPRFFAERGRPAFCHDKYVVSPFSGLAWSGEKPVSLAIATEIFEHLPDPRSDLDDIFGIDPDFLLATTCRYQHEDSEWFYIAPQTGEHVFFYTDEALRIIARRYGYHVYMPTWKTALFSKRALSGAQRLLMKGFMGDGQAARLGRALINAARHG